LLVAQDNMPRIRIAEECGITAASLYEWLKMPLFQALVSEHIADIEAQISNLPYVKRRDRIAALAELAEDIATIRDERAAFAIDLAAAKTEDGKPAHPEIQGGRTGWVVRSRKVIGVGKAAQVIEEDAFDKALSTEYRATLEHIARERGEWSEKREHSGPGGAPLLPIVEIEVVLPLDDDAEGVADVES
jgi:hypothetical protein